MVGALSLRTRGVYFIMITLAFAQMIYYVAIGLDRYGGDDGLTIDQRSSSRFLELNNKTAVLLSLLRSFARRIYLVTRLVNSRFGQVIRGVTFQRTAHARARLSGLSLQAGLLRDRRRACADSPARCSPITPIRQPRRSCTGPGPAT